jgi:hypothetical protein
MLLDHPDDRERADGYRGQARKPDQISNSAMAINITKPLALSMLPLQRIAALRASAERSLSASMKRWR